MENKTPFVPIYFPVIAAVNSVAGARGVGCFVLFCQRADFSAGWTFTASLRDLARACGVAVGTLQKSVLGPLEIAGLIKVEAAAGVASRITLCVMADVQSGKGVSLVDTVLKNKSVSAIDTPRQDLREVFKGFLCDFNQNAQKTVSTGDTLPEQKQKSVSAVDTLKSVSAIDTPAPLHTTPSNDLLINNNINNNIAKTENKKNKFAPTLQQVQAYFAERNYITNPEDFYNKNEARDWTWCDRAGKTHKIKNWKATAYEFEKRTRARGHVNFDNPQKLEERLFCWYYKLVVPALFASPAARDARWWREKGDFAFIAAVAGSLERAQQIITRAAERLEKAKFAATIKAIANMAVNINDELGDDK